VTTISTRHALLHVSLDADLRLRYRLEIDDESIVGNGPLLAHLTGITACHTNGPSDLQAASSRLRQLARRSGVLPLSIDQPIKSWAFRGGDPILFVKCADERIDEIPWELLPSGQRWPNVLVARLGADSADAAKLQIAEPQVLLVVAWRHVGATKAGMEREVAELPKRMQGTALQVVTLEDPTQRQLLDACRAHKPLVVHLATSELVRTDRGPGIEVAARADSSAPAPDPVVLDELAAALRACGSTQLVVLSIRDSNEGAALMSRRSGVPAIGWLGPVEDQTAIDFSFLLYDRLAARRPLTRTIREFTSALPFGADGRRNGLVVTWLPSCSDWQLPIERRQTGQVAHVAKPEAPAAPEQLEVSLDFSPVPVISQALLHSERSCVARLALNSSGDASGVILQVTCDTGAGRSSVRRTLALTRGMTPLPERSFSFPVLYELASRRVSRRAINFTVSLTRGDTLLCEETRSSLWLGFDEWLDREDAWCFAPAYVQPLNPTVLEIVRTASETLKLLGDSTDTFQGYQRPDYTRRQLEALFQTLRRREYALDYTVPGPLVYTGDAQPPSGQRVRLPHDILRYRRATCYDLVLLLAACVEQVGLRPLIVLAVNHAVLGVWNNAADYDQYWRSREQARTSDAFGEDWMMREPGDLKSIVERGAIELIECVYVTRADRRFRDACAGWLRGSWADLIERFQAAVDVHRARRSVPPTSSPESECHVG